MANTTTSRTHSGISRPARRYIDRDRSLIATERAGAARVGVTTGGLLTGMIQALRPHQWSKNLLLFVPVLTALQAFHAARVIRAAVGVAAFSLVASAVYVLNDLVDLRSDRLHPRKRRRPFASGRVPIATGLKMALALTVAGLGLGLGLSPSFAALLGIYLLLTTVYTTYLKRKLLADVACLALLYTFRIHAGGVAASIPISNWLMAFSMFLFLSLAFVKRYTELAKCGLGRESLPGRGYRFEDLPLIQSIGAACGLLCVLVLCLYVNSPEVARLYRTPDRLWLACPVLLCWVARIWFLAARGELDDDPVLFALKDPLSYAAGAGIGAIALAAV
jgi:4-hydroxybenzoate polyprenyltransferase